MDSEIDFCCFPVVYKSAAIASPPGADKMDAGCFIGRAEGQQLRRWDWKTLLYPQHSCHSVANRRWKPNQVWEDYESKENKQKKCPNRTSIQIQEKVQMALLRNDSIKRCKRTLQKNKIHFVFFCFFSKKWNKTGINKWKCFNRVHSFTLAGKHQMHWQKCCFLNGFCLHKEPDVMIIRVQVVCSVSQKTWLASSSVSDESLDFRLTSVL